MTDQESIAGPPDVRRRRTWPWVTGALIGVVLLVSTGFLLGWTFARNTPIPLVEITQQDGTLREGDDIDHRCIERSDHSQVCGRLRLSSQAMLPEIGTYVRGGYGEVPSDASDLQEPSFLWLTPAAP